MKISRTHLLTAIAAVILYAGPLFYLQWAIREAHFVVASRSRPGEISVLDYGAKADGVTDDGPAFESAFSDAARRNVTLAIPKGTYMVNREIKIQSGMLIRSDGATLKHTDSQINILSAVRVDGWVLEGPLTLVGARTAKTQQGATEIGLLIASNSHYIVNKLTVMHFSGTGIKITSGKRPKLAARGRGNHGQFAFVSFIDNHVGLEIADGTGAEYNLFTLLSFSDNDVATRITAGNNVISTSNIVDNGNGVELSGGSNDGHGIFSATNINHNAGFNIRTVGIQNGYTFNACHIYAGSPAEGRIELNNSFGIHVNGGQIDSKVIQNEGGVNVMVNSLIAGSIFDVTGSHANSLHCTGLFDRVHLIPRACNR